MGGKRRGEEREGMSDGWEEEGVRWKNPVPPSDRVGVTVSRLLSDGNPLPIPEVWDVPLPPVVKGLDPQPSCGGPDCRCGAVSGVGVL